MKKFCPNCEALLKPTSNPTVGRCPDCGREWPYGTGLTEPSPPRMTPKMPYLSIDIETTGLDPERHQILEIGAVWDDWTTPVERLPVYHQLVVHPEYHGSAYALGLNAELLKKLANASQDCLKPGCVAYGFSNWLKNHGWDGTTSLTPAGKNFASFDRQ
ncbi:MAG: hypothetical protein ACYDH4_12815, partial [Candidatus Cryosericum sp.]